MRLYEGFVKILSGRLYEHFVGKISEDSLILLRMKCQHFVVFDNKLLEKAGDLAHEITNMYM